MKAITTVLALVLFAGTAVAQESPAEPDYSRDTLMRLFVASGEPVVEPPVRYHVGAVQFNALGTSWRFNYLPIMMPFPGTRDTVSREWPDAFALTGTAIATSPRSWRTMRNLNSEMRRIERVTNPDATIRVDVD